MPGIDASNDATEVVGNIKRLSLEMFTDTCQHILSYLQGLTRGVDSSEISSTFQRNGVNLDENALQSLIRFLMLTFRWAGKSQLSAGDLVSKLEEGCSQWPKAFLQAVHTLWTTDGPLVQTQQDVHAMLSIGQLVDMQWKLGMAVSSDTCRSLNSPFVSVLLKIAQPSGQISQKSFEMTIPQFQNFHQQFKEIAAVLETV